MTKQSKNTIRNWFKNGAFPDQFHFWDWMDSFFHKDEQIPASQIDQLQDLLDAKVDRKDLPDGEMAMDDIYGLNSALDAKVDKQEGKGLSAEDFSSELKTKVDGLEEGANKYEHPLTHSANMIEETADKAFISNAEKLANVNHIDNVNLHKTSEQIRSEIVEADIPESIARQSYVATSADGVLSAILGGVSESYDTLKKVYDWIFAHDGNTDIHKTSEQVRSEIVEADIPESIARLTDISVSSLQEVTEAGATSDQNVSLSGKEVVLGDIFNANVSVRNDPDNSIEFLQQSINMSTSEVQFLMNKTEFFVSSNDFETGNVSDFKLDNSKIDLISPKISALTNELRMGDKKAIANKRLIADNGVGTSPELRYNVSTNLWEYSNDGVIFNNFGKGDVPTLQSVTKEGASTDVFTVFTGGASSSDGWTTRYGKSAAKLATGNIWTAIGGSSALHATSGNKWTAVGTFAGYSNTVGQSWTAIGSWAGYDNIEGSDWTAVGRSAGGEGEIGNAWTAIGAHSGVFNEGDDWVAIGDHAGYKSKKGSNWIAIGKDAARNFLDGTEFNDSQTISFNNSTYVGTNTKVSSNGVENESVFGFEAEGKGSNTVSLGNNTVTDVYSYGTFNSSNVSPLGSSPEGINATAGYVLTADGSGGSSWEVASGGGSTPTLQEVTSAGASTDIFTTFTGGITVGTTGVAGSISLGRLSDGSDRSFFEQSDANTLIRNTDGNGNIEILPQFGDTKLGYNNLTKLQTTGSGTKTTGSHVVTLDAANGNTLLLRSAGRLTSMGSLNGDFFHMGTEAAHGFYMYDSLSAAKLTSRGGISAVGVVEASGGSSEEWNAAHGWGDHAGLYSRRGHSHYGYVNASSAVVRNTLTIDTSLNDGSRRSEIILGVRASNGMVNSTASIYSTRPGVNVASYKDTELHLETSNRAGDGVNTLTFDAHGDLLVPRDVKAANVYGKTTQVKTGVYGNTTINTSVSTNAKVVLTKDLDVRFAGLTDGMSGKLKFTQDATGGHALTMSPTPKVSNGGNGEIVLTGTANSTDVLSWWYDGVDLNVSCELNYN